MKSTPRLLALPLLASLLAGAPCSAATEMDEAWLPEEETAPAGGPALEFMPLPPTVPVHHHTNHITIHPDSLRSGWVPVQQCHAHLDAVARTEIVFGTTTARSLTITETHGIDEARVSGATVQLAGIHRGARICLQLESRALHPLGDGRYLLRNGPYMRQFFDSYFPMQVTMQVNYPTSLELESATPPPQAGLQLQTQMGTLRLDSHFRGRLITELVFRARR